MPRQSETAAARRASGRSAALVGSGVLISRFSGLLREIVFAGLLGTKAVADAFKAALQIPGLLQNVLGEGVLSASFVPVYSREVERDEATGRDDASAVAGTIAAILGLVTALIVLVGIVAARPLTKVFLPFLPDDTFELTVDLVRVMWAGLGFIVLAAWALGVLNAHRRFFLSYVAPVLWNASQVVLALWAWGRDWSDADIARAAAWGVAIGGVLQFAVQLPAVFRVAPSIRLSLQTQLEPVRDVLRRFSPAVVGRGVVQLSAFLDLFLAGLLAAGAIQGLSLAQILYLLPIGVFAMSVAAAELPELSREHDRPALLAARMRTGQERIAFFVIFCAVAFIAAGKPIVGAAFERGEFTADDTIFVWAVLGTYSLGLAASSVSRLLQNACYATGDVSGPARLAALRVTVAAAVGAVLMLQLDRFGVVGERIEKLGDLPAFGLLPEDVRETDTGAQRLGALGLAIGSAVGALLEYSLLRRRVNGVLDGTRRLGRPIQQLALPAGAALVVAAVSTWLLDDVPALLAAAPIVGLSGLVYVGLAYLRGSQSAAELLRTAHVLR